jgi:hypothetical protein
MYWSGFEEVCRSEGIMLAFGENVLVNSLPPLEQLPAEYLYDFIEPDTEVLRYCV